MLTLFASPTRHPEGLSTPRRFPLAGLGLLCLALSGVLSGCKNSVPPPAAEPEPILEGRQLHFPDKHPQLALLKATPAAAATSVDVALSARLVWNEARTQRLYASLGGRVERIGADVGQAVKAGAVLATLASPDLGQAQADAARARADQVQARKQLQRQSELLDAGIVARRDFEQAQADAARSDAELARTEARLRLYGGSAGVNQQMALRAGIAGYVVERNLNPGQELRPDLSGPGVPPLFVVSDPTSLWVLIDAREAEAGSLRPGDSFDLEVPAWPGRRFQGTVMAASDAIDPTTRTIKIRGLIANPERLLKSEMLGTAHVQRQLGAGVIVPPDAVMLRGERHWVFVQVKPGVFEPREVKIGPQGPRYVVVSQGLAGGEQVVTENALLLARQFRISEEEARQGAPAASGAASASASASGASSGTEGKRP